MKKNIGVVGHKTKLGSLLVQKPNFFSVDDELVNDVSLLGKVDVLVNCNVVLQVPDWGKQYELAITLIRRLHELHNKFGPDILTLAPNGKGAPTTIIVSATRALSHVHGGKIALVPECNSDKDYQIIADQLEMIAITFDTVSKTSYCKLPNFFTRLFGIR
jgi:hypothetical protein